MRAVIFLGPSLPVAEAREILDAIYLPPARQSDLLSALGIYQPDVIGLIDGEFGQSLSVWHKEILYALERGIPVFGASSMGALRAAETADYGMVGVGEVYRMYASGELTDDDEVALAHATSEEGYRALSEPMVNVRVTLRRAREAGVIDGAVEERLVAVAKGLFFPARTWTQILRTAAAAGVSRQALAAVDRYAAEHAVDIKRLDAIELLTTIRDLPEPVPKPAVTFRLERSHLFETLYERDRTVRHAGADVPLAAIANYAALHLPGFTELNVHALNRALVVVLADLLEAEVSDADVEEEAKRFRLARRLVEDARLEAWLRANDLDHEEFRTLMREMAQCRALHRWLVIRMHLERTTKIVLDELRLTGQYEEMAGRAAAQERILAEHVPHFKESSYQQLSTPQLVVDHLRATACRMDTAYDVWAEEAGFHSTDDLRIELLRARLAREFVGGLAREVTGALEAAPVAGADGGR